MDVLIAQTTFGTKPSAPTPPPTTASPVSGLQMLQMLVALGVVGLLLKYGIPKLMAKWGKRLSPGATSSIEVLESAAFGAGQVQVVKVRGRTLLIGVTAQNVSCLADLTEHEDTLHEEPAFFEMLDQEVAEPEEMEEPAMPTHAVIEMPMAEETEKIFAAENKAEDEAIEEARRMLMEAKMRAQAKQQAAAPAEDEDPLAVLKRLERLAG